MPLNETLTIDQAIAMLNTMVSTDRSAMERLIDARVPCQDMLGHPTVQCTESDEGMWYVGLLGVLNGLFGTIEDGPKDGWGPIAAVYNDQDVLVGFRRTDAPVVKPKDPA